MKRITVIAVILVLFIFCMTSVVFPADTNAWKLVQYNTNSLTLNIPAITNGLGGGASSSITNISV